MLIAVPLDQLGWSAFYSQQLALEDLNAGFPARVCSVQRSQVTVLCERGTGDDAGRWRASFYHEGRRVRLVVDAEGNVLAED